MDVSVGTRLRVLRKDAGLTQAQLAALADTNQAAPVHRDCCPFHRLCVIGRNVRLSCSQRRICRFQV